MKKLALFGSTGSIGRSTLDIIEKFPDQFSVSVLAGARNTALLAQQAARFNPDILVVLDADRQRQLEQALPCGFGGQIWCGPEGYQRAAAHEPVDTVITAMVGAAGLMPTVSAIDAGKNIALANKETLVMAGEWVMARARQQGVSITPIDSEHSAIYQCLQGNRRQELSRIFLTGSGGPFRKLPLSDFHAITVEQALNHPNWSMGAKITIDSATMMNKGLEFIEAKWLFDAQADQIEVVIHPQSIIHSMVAYQDGSVMAQLGVPDMKSAIAYALTGPQRLPLGQPLPQWSEIGQLTFESPDLKRFPCLDLAFKACRIGGVLPAVLNAANETAVAAFLDHRIGFLQIAQIIEAVMAAHASVAKPQLEDFLHADRWARQTAQKIIGRDK